MGGGVMRAAAKTAVAGGYRAAQAAWLDQAAAAARRPARPPAAALSVPGQAAEGAPPMSASFPAPVAPVVDAGAAAREQRAPWNVEGWEVVPREEEELFEALHPAAPARLVFGPVPTLEEAKEATSDLKDALEKLYFSPTATGLEGSAVAAKTTFSESSCLESMDAENQCAVILPSPPRHVVQAFSLLQGCPEAQDVVASLASDKNVWDAVMKNEKVMEFYKTHQINTPPAETAGFKEESVDEDGKYMDSSVGKEAPESFEDGFMGFVNSIKESIKVKVTEVVNSLSDLFKDLMGKIEAKTTTCEGGNFNMGVGASFFALATAAILVILVKRG